jgi:D-xylose 1-dehydrogenase (NADP+, D-xylono-1,5-lactone-forming)
MTERPARPVRWGILGAARINELVVSACRGSAEVEFVAIASRDAERARAHADALGVPQAFGSYEQLVAAEDIDAVYVPLPNAMHVEWSMRSLDAGKHVLCEKPFSSDPHGVADAFALAQRRDLVLAEAFMYRFHPQTELVRDLLRRGRIGELAFIHAEEIFVLDDDPHDFRLRADMDGGALMDVGCYCVNAARMLAGEPEHVAATAWHLGEETDMRFSGTLGFPGNVVATFHCAMDLPLRSRLDIVGTRGAIALDDPWQCEAASIGLFDEAGLEQRIAVPPIDRYRAQFEAFSRAVVSGSRLELGQDDAVAQAAVLRRLLDEARIAG